MRNHRVRDLQEGEGGVQVCRVAFCYLACYRLRRLDRAERRAGWFRQRAHGLATQGLRGVEAADLGHRAVVLPTEEGRRPRLEQLAKAVPGEQRRPT